VLEGHSQWVSQSHFRAMADGLSLVVTDRTGVDGSTGGAECVDGNRLG